MYNLNLQAVLIAIVLAILGAFVIRYIVRKNKREELLKETTTKFEEVKKLFVDSNEGLLRAEQISKSDESITLFNKWYKEFKDLEVELSDLEVDYNDVVKCAKKSKHKDFLKLNKSVNFKIESLNEKISALHKLLFNFTNYEYENTIIALNMKEALKVLQNGFEINLAPKEIYTPTFNHECEIVARELTRFEDLQKLGEYPKARKHLKNTTDIINGLEHNYNIIINIQSLCTNLEANIAIIDEVSKRISERNFRLDQDEYLQNYDSLKIQKDAIEKELEEFNFKERISDEYVVAKEQEISEIQDSIFNIKQSIEEQYGQIKKIEELISINEQLIEQSDGLVAGALEERNEINHLYQMPSNKAIQKLEVEITRYHQFKRDYEVLLDLVYDLKENYEILASRVTKSNEFLKHFIGNMQEAIAGLKEIRIDEIKALESIESYKKSVTFIEFYLTHTEHIHQMSMPLTNLLSEAYEKIEQLNIKLAESPLNISEVRKLTIASESLIADLEVQAEEEIKTCAYAQNLIRFANRYIEDKKSQDILSHAMTLYNNHNYQNVVKEIRQVIYSDFESAELLYKQILEGSKYQTIAQYKKEL